MFPDFLKNEYQIVEKAWFGYWWSGSVIKGDGQNSTLFVGDKKFKLVKDYDNIFSDEQRKQQFLKIQSIYPIFKFRNDNLEPDTYNILGSDGEFVGRLQNGNRIANNYWKILDTNNNEIGRLSKTVNFTGFLYDFVVVLGWFSLGILELLIRIIIFPIFPKLFEIKYTIKVDSKIIAELRRITTPISVVMNVKILNQSHEIDERLILASALRAFPGGTTFYPKNSGGGYSD